MDFRHGIYSYTNCCPVEIDHFRICHVRELQCKSIFFLGFWIPNLIKRVVITLLITYDPRNCPGPLPTKPDPGPLAADDYDENSGFRYHLMRRTLRSSPRTRFHQWEGSSRFPPRARCFFRGRPARPAMLEAKRPIQWYQPRTGPHIWDPRAAVGELGRHASPPSSFFLSFLGGEYLT